jgi:AAA15 family ATPase/GTPase
MMDYGGYMLIDFTVENFRSIKEPQTLSMLASKINDHSKNCYNSTEKNIKILRSAVICGANASGKSNLLLSLSSFIDFIKNSTDLKVGEKIPCYTPFKLDESFQNKPTTFEMEFTNEDDIRYKYCVKFNREEVLFESLVFYPKGKEAILFVRESGKPINYGDLLKGDKKTIEKQLLNNNLFFSKAANSNNEQLQLLYTKLGNISPIALFENAEASISSVLTSHLLNKGNDVVTSNINKLIKSADTGIESVELYKSEKYIDEGFKKILEDDSLMRHANENIVKSIIDSCHLKPRMMHNFYDNNTLINKVPFDLDEESAGTQKLYVIAGMVISSLLSGNLCILDEIANYLHPYVMESIIKIFNDPQKNSKNAQLIFATHNVAVLKREILRRDQIWFAEKDKFGATKLYSMSEFDYRKVRKDIPFDRWYMNGRFGAVPTIKSF